MSLTYTWEEVEIPESDSMFCVEVDVDFHWSPGTPGYVSGPPEDCYPPEPDEVEINDVTILSVTEIDEDGNETELALTEDVAKFWADKFEEEKSEDEDFIDLLRAEGAEADEAAYEAAQEARMDEMRELNWL